MPKYSLRERKSTNYNVKKTLDNMVNNAMKAAKQKRIEKTKADTRRRKKLKKKQEWNVLNRHKLGVDLFKLLKVCTPRNKYIDELFQTCYEYDDHFTGDFNLLTLSKESLVELQKQIKYFHDQERLLQRGIGTPQHIQKVMKKISLMDEKYLPAILDIYNSYAEKFIEEEEEVELDLNFPFPPIGIKALDNCIKKLH